MQFAAQNVSYDERTWKGCCCVQNNGKKLRGSECTISVSLPSLWQLILAQLDDHISHIREIYENNIARCEIHCFIFFVEAIIAFIA